MIRRRFFYNAADIVNDCLTVVALEDGLTAKLSVNACEYCVDGNGNWKSLPADTETQTINTGQTLSFRAKLIPIEEYGIGTFTVNKQFNLKGNCMLKFTQIKTCELADLFKTVHKSISVYEKLS